MSKLEEQPVPDNAQCPECGGEPTVESAAESRLHNIGYLADDQPLVCEDCGYNGEDGSWVHGVPIGDYDGGEDLICESCGDEVRIHRVKLNLPRLVGAIQRADGESIDAIADEITPEIALDTKCANCFKYENQGVQREFDENGVALIGYPSITGTQDGAEPFGWRE